MATRCDLDDPIQTFTALSSRTQDCGVRELPVKYHLLTSTHIRNNIKHLQQSYFCIVPSFLTSHLSPLFARQAGTSNEPFLFCGLSHKPQYGNIIMRWSSDYISTGLYILLCKNVLISLLGRWSGRFRASQVASWHVLWNWQGACGGKLLMKWKCLNRIGVSQGCGEGVVEMLLEV